jgi:hypothetical protein
MKIGERSKLLLSKEAQQLCNYITAKIQGENFYAFKTGLSEIIITHWIRIESLEGNKFKEIW